MFRIMHLGTLIKMYLKGPIEDNDRGMGNNVDFVLFRLADLLPSGVRLEGYIQKGQNEHGLAEARCSVKKFL